MVEEPSAATCTHETASLGTMSPSKAPSGTDCLLHQKGGLELFCVMSVHFKATKSIKAHFHSSGYLQWHYELHYIISGDQTVSQHFLAQITSLWSGVNDKSAPYGNLELVNHQPVHLYLM